MVTETKDRAWPDFPMPPGALLQEELEAIGMTQQELATRTGRPAQVINEIIRGKKQITQDTALEFEKVLGIPAHIWVNLEADYQLTSARIRERDELSSQESWLEEFPVREMERRGWVPTCPSKIDKVRALLRFLGVASFSAWQQTVVGLRVSSRASVSRGALAAWLRKGELDGYDVQTGGYSEQEFRRTLLAIRSLTTEPPDVFEPKLKETCAGAGVAVVFTRELRNSGAHGSARWLTPDKALIQLSLRYRTNDQLWFSFFHEACHVLQHRIREVHIDYRNGDDDGAEEEANRFAQDLLIPQEIWKAFVRSQPRTRADVLNFAQNVGIAPGIVVGRLQREKKLPYSHLNDLKDRFKWIDE